MARLPFLKFFPNDWLAEPSLRTCSLAARGLWIDMLSLMHLSPRRGYLLSASGSPFSPEQLARMTGCSADEATRLIAELMTSGACNCTDDGVIYSRRMVRDEGKREKCSEAGRKGGGNPNLHREDEQYSTFKGGSKGAPKGEAKGGSKAPEARGHLHSSTKSAATTSRPPPVEKTGKPEARPPDPVHQPAVDAFCAAWREKYGQKLPTIGGPGGDAVRYVLDTVDRDLERFRAVVRRFFADPDPYLSQRRHPLTILRSQLPKWLVDDAPAERPRVKRATPADNPALRFSIPPTEENDRVHTG